MKIDTGKIDNSVKREGASAPCVAVICASSQPSR